MSYTVYITEENVGYLTFDTKEEAEAWIDNPVDFDGVRWIENFVSKFELVPEE
jgi:hypothetical protein